MNSILQAFFRRAVQSGKDKTYRCKKESECGVSVASRRGCQKCRFSKCLLVGMTASWVLSDEQCSIRWRGEMAVMAVVMVGKMAYQ